MTVSITHPFVSSVVDLNNPGEVGPGEWNAVHSLTGGAALTKIDDTNVTLTLGGTPNTALLEATSLTLGWTGTLALSRLTQGTNGQLIVGQTSAAPQYKTISGDITIAASGTASVVSLSGSALTNPTAPIGLTTVNGTAVTAMRSDAAPALSQAISPTWTQPHLFVPSSGSYAAAFVTTGSRPALFTSQTPGSGTFANGVGFNAINVDNDAVTVTSGINNALFVNYTNVGGSTLTGARQAISSNMNFVAASSVGNTSRNYVAVQGNVNISDDDTGTNTGAGAAGAFFGMNPGVQTTSSNAINLAAVVGMEVDVSMIAGSTTRDLLGISVVKLSGTGAVGVRNDAAIQIGAATGVTAWQNAFWISRTANGAQPLTATGVVIGSDSAVSGGSAMTMGSFADFHLDTFSNDIFYFNNFRVTGAGKLTLGASGILDYGITTTNSLYLISNATTSCLLYGDSSVNAQIQFGNQSASNISNTLLMAWTLKTSVSSRNYATMAVSASDVTDATRTGALDFSTVQSGTLASRMILGAGLGIGTTSDPGAGLIYTNAATFMCRSKTTWNNGAAAAAGTLLNAPAVGNPTKWIPVDDNGTTRYIPSW